MQDIPPEVVPDVPENVYNPQHNYNQMDPAAMYLDEEDDIEYAQYK